MRLFNAWVVIAGVLAGVAAAMVVVLTHEVRIPPAMAAGLVEIPDGFVYEIPAQPTLLAEMESTLAGENANHFVWWTFLGEMRLASGDRPGAMRAWQRGADLAIEASGDPELKPNEWGPAYRAGWNLWRLGQAQEAETWMKKALGIIEANAMWSQTRDGRNSNRQNRDRLGQLPSTPTRTNENEPPLVFGGVRYWDLHFIGYARRVSGDEAGAEIAFAEMIERQAAYTTQRSDGGSYYYDLARLLAKLGEREAALLAFEAAARHRRFDGSNAWWTPSFESIRDDPRFRAVLDGDVPPGERWPEIGPPLAGDEERSNRFYRGE